MKVAIIGSGPKAILAAMHFDQIGAEVTLFQRSPLGGNLRFIKDQFPNSEITYQNEKLTTLAFFDNIIVPSVLELEKHQLTKQGDVLRVHKRFLHPGESIPNHTRMHDLFRVVYSLNPQENILKQLEENPELFNQLGAEVIASLHKPVESFLDFDVVIEACGLGSPALPMGSGGALALNESNLQNGSLIFYQKDIFNKLELGNKKTIVLVGEGDYAKFSLLKLKDWLLQSPEHELHWVTYKSEIEQTQNEWLDKEVKSFLSLIDREFEMKKVSFEKAIREWRDLEDYVKVKVPKPHEPKSRIHLHFGYDVTSVDCLLDRSGVFATIEIPDYRPGHEAEKPNMMTLSADAICVARGVSKNSLFNINKKEAGYYVLDGESIKDISHSLNDIELDLLNYFKKA